MKNQPPRSTVRVGPQGRITIPAALRALLGVEPGQTLVARVQDRALVLEPDGTALEPEVPAPPREAPAPEREQPGPGSEETALDRVRSSLLESGLDADLVERVIEERRREAGDGS